MVTQDIGQCLWSMLVMQLTVSICESDSFKISEDSNRHRVVMEETMLLNGRGDNTLKLLCSRQSVSVLGAMTAKSADHLNWKIDAEARCHPE